MPGCIVLANQARVRLVNAQQSEHVDLDSQTRMMFEEMDEDDSGMLDRAEVKMLCKMLGMPLTDDEVDKAMVTMDEDGANRSIIRIRNLCVSLS